MEIKLAKLTSKGQLTLPVDIRRKLGLEEGGQVVFLLNGDDVRIANAAVWLNGQSGGSKGSVENFGGKEQEKAPRSRRQSIPGQPRRG